MRKYLLSLIVLLSLGLLLTGCESDSTAPNDDLPALSSEDVANQSGAMAAAMTQVLPRIWNPQNTKDNGEYEYTFASGPVDGHRLLRVPRCRRRRPGGLRRGRLGPHVHHRCALNITLIDGGIPWLLGFNLTADINQATDTATAAGSGTLVVGDYSATFTLAGVVVQQGEDYPAAGIITFVNEGITAIVTFDGDDMVTVTVGDESWTIDLDDGSLS